MRFRVLQVALLALVGCGNPRASVEGTVSLDGVPIDFGTIAFVPLETTQSPSAGGMILRGVYRIDAERGPLPGTFRVEISGQKKTGEKKRARDIPDFPPSDELVELTVELLPEKYNKQSSLISTIQSGRNTINFDLTKN